MTPEKIAELKDKHGQDLVEIDGCVFRKPSRTEYDRWFDKMQTDKGQASKHARELAQSCLVFPGTEAFTKLIDDKPGVLAVDLVNALTEMVGLKGEDTVKKL